MGRGSFAAAVLAVIVALSAAGCGTDSAETTKTSRARSTSPVSAEVIALGKRVFAEHCYECHTIAGNPHPPMTHNDPAGPNFDEIEVSRSYVADRVRRGGIAMQSFQSELSRREFNAVVEYVTATAGRDVDAGAEESPDLIAGERVFADHCQRCHSIADRPMGARPDWPGTDFRKVKPSVKFIERIVIRRYSYMEFFTDKLTRAEVKAVAQYVHALSRP